MNIKSKETNQMRDIKKLIELPSDTVDRIKDQALKVNMSVKSYLEHIINVQSHNLPLPKQMINTNGIETEI